MKKETAKEVLDIHLSKMISEHPDVYDTLDEMREKPEYQVLIKAMIEFAKIKCKQQRELCFNEISTEDKKDIDLYETVETVKRFVLNAPTPDFE